MWGKRARTGSEWLIIKKSQMIIIRTLTRTFRISTMMSLRPPEIWLKFFQVSMGETKEDKSKE